MRRRKPDARRYHEAGVHRHSVAHLRVDAVAGPVHLMRASAVGHLPAPQRLGPAPRLSAPRRGHPRRQPQRARRARVPPERQRHPALGEPVGLMHHQGPHPHVERQPRDRIGEGEAAADVHARARLRVAAVAAQTHLDARLQRQLAAAEGVAPRALQRRTHSCYPGVGRVQAAHRAVDQAARRAHSQRVGLERQREPARGPRADQLATRPRRRHCHRHARLHRPSAAVRASSCRRTSVARRAPSVSGGSALSSRMARSPAPSASRVRTSTRSTTRLALVGRRVANDEPERRVERRDRPERPGPTGSRPG